MTKSRPPRPLSTGDTGDPDIGELMLMLLGAEERVAVAYRLVVSLVFRIPVGLLPDDEQTALLEALESEE